jgi:hypothetical protein
MSRSFRLLRPLYGVVLLMVLAACGLPSDVRQAGEALPARFSQAAEQIDAREQAYAAYVRSPAYATDQRYAERERWADAFAEARRALGDVRAVYGRDLLPLLVADQNNMQWNVRTQIARIDSLVVVAVGVAERPFMRRGYLARVRLEAPVLAVRADSAHEAMAKPLASLRAVLRAARRNHPNKREDLAGKLAGVDSAATAADSAVRGVRTQLALHTRGEPADYALLGDGTALLVAGAARMDTLAPRLKRTVEELDQSYTRILSDQRADYYVVVARTSWDDRSDYNTEDDHVYPPVQVDESVYDVVLQWDNTDVAEYRSGFFGSGIRAQMPLEAWQALRVPEGLPGRHDSADYWIHDHYMRGFHRYIVVEDGRQTETDWVEVDDEDWLEYQEDLGMEIASKPYGMYESEVADVSAPPGMGFVGDPRYGCWRTDEDGPCLDAEEAAEDSTHSAWYYGGRYGFMGGLVGWGGRYRPYRYSEWNRWNRDFRGRDSYYGPDPAAPSYGTWSPGVRDSPRFRTSTYAVAGGFGGEPDGSVRGAGRALRGGGPGGGGK